MICMSTTYPNLTATELPRDNWLEIVRQQVESLRFGTVEIVVQDSRVVQIERTERVRLAKAGQKAIADGSGIGNDLKNPSLKKS